MDRETYVSTGEYTLYPLAETDREFYVKLQRQISGEATLFCNPAIKDIMWESVLTSDTRIYSIFDSDNEYCGSIELQNPFAQTPEIGINLLENKRGKGIAPEAVKMLANKVYHEREVEYFLIRISSLNTHSIHVFEKIGAVRFYEKEDPFQTIIKQLTAELGEDLLNKVQDSLKNIYLSTNGETEAVYCYKLLPQVFINGYVT